MTSHFVLAAALVGLGRMTEAREAVRAGLALNPAFTIARYRASPSSDNPRYLAGLDRILDRSAKPACRRGEDQETCLLAGSNWCFSGTLRLTASRFAGVGGRGRSFVRRGEKNDRL